MSCYSSRRTPSSAPAAGTSLPHSTLSRPPQLSTNPSLAPIGWQSEMPPLHLIHSPGKAYLSRLTQVFDAVLQSRDISTGTQVHWLNTEAGSKKPISLISRHERDSTVA